MTAPSGPPALEHVAGSDATSAPARHAARADRARSALGEVERVSRRYSSARLAVGVGTMVLALLSLNDGAPRAMRWAVGAGAVGFLLLVRRHDRVERRAEWLRTVATLEDEAGWRASRAWDRLPPPVLPPADPHHPFAADLDLFGRASLVELIGPPGTAHGCRTLAAWLATPASAGEIVARQEAVRELAGQRDLRQALAAHGRLVSRVAAFDLSRFLEWSEAPAWLGARPLVAWGARVLTVATPVLFVLQALGVVEGAWWLASIAAGFALSWAVRKPLDAALGRSGAWEPAIRSYRELLQTIETAPWASGALRGLQARLDVGSRRASHGVARLERLVAFADLRHAPLLHLPVHALTLWDFHVWAALESWQRDSGTHVREWLDAIGTAEGLAALASLADDHPHWAYPNVTPEAAAIEAVALGHPLLPEAARVCNDITVGPPGRVLCITGSNMSGKSTLLRAIGVNVVLAQAGAPVCAAALRMPPVSVYTSLRISDSLEEGVSYFMSALARLRTIVEAATEASTPETPRPPVLYLLDEILQGTNTVERELAVRVIVRHLAASRAVGAITTHDLGLTATPELAAHGDQVHFTETVADEGAGAISFDYRLRPGVATSRNALRLMALVGLLHEGDLAALDRA